MKHNPAFHPDELRFAHSDGLARKTVFVGGKVGTVETTAVRAPDVLERLHNRATIDDKQHAAAIAWAADYERAGMSIAVCASYGGSVAASSEAEPERRRAAKERFRRGHDAMTGRGASIVWGVVIDNRQLSDWPWPVPYTSERLREALDELADFYG
jgi:hypothetical protein